MNKIISSVLKNRLSAILSVGHPSFSVVSGILSNSGVQLTIKPTTDFLKHLIFSNSFEIQFFGFLGYIVSCGYPTRITIPIREEIQLLMYGCAILSLNVNILPISFGAVKAIFH